MRTYISDCYGFEVKSKQYFMDLVIEPSFNPAICIQFHEMADSSYKAFYNYQPQKKEFVNALKSFYEQNNVDPHTEARITIERASSAGVFKPLAPVYCYDFEEEERRCVDERETNVCEENCIEHEQNRI